MEYNWTYASLKEDWVYDTYTTKEEAIQAGKLEFDGEFLVGQLIGENLEYLVDNVEVVTGARVVYSKKVDYSIDPFAAK